MQRPALRVARELLSACYAGVIRGRGDQLRRFLNRSTNLSPGAVRRAPGAVAR